jgi:hypothetical protein
MAGGIAAESAAEVFTGYASDMSDDVDIAVPEDNNSGNDANDSESDNENAPETSFATQPPPPLKRQRLNIPARIARQRARERRQAELESAQQAIEKLIESKKEVFKSGQNGLQAYRARAIQSYLHMVVCNKQKGIDASQRAAESQGFAEKWGGRLVRRWVRKWVESHELPHSLIGHHVKSFTLLADPAIRAEL